MRRSLILGPAVAILLSACGAAPAVSDRVSPGPSTTAEPTTPGASTSPTPPGPPETPEPEALAWARHETDGPAAREDHTWTLDAAGDVAYLFGGRDGGTAFDDTWAFDLRDDSWTRLAPAPAPPARFGHEAAWVEGIGLVIFAGQADPQSFFNDLWAYDPASDAWAELPAGGAPPVPRYGSCAAVGPDGRLWISHGFTQEGARFSDTRAYDFSAGSWADETPAAGARPVERCLHGCWWTESGELALYAGQTTGITALDDRWTLVDGQWTSIQGELPPARNLYARSRHDDAELIFGGQALDGGFLADLWLLADDAADAQRLEPAGEPPAGRAGAELIVDAARGRALLFGGRTGDGVLDDLWTLAGL